jgi:hypothetical protein
MYTCTYTHDSILMMSRRGSDSFSVFVLVVEFFMKDASHGSCHSYICIQTFKLNIYKYIFCYPESTELCRNGAASPCSLPRIDQEGVQQRPAVCRCARQGLRSCHQLQGQPTDALQISRIGKIFSPAQLSCSALHR